MRLIDADALQRKICGAKCGCEYEDCGNEGDCAFDHFIFHAPTIEAEPVRHGRWIYHPDDLFPAESKQECSCCHEEEYLTLYNETYCPNCGAKMDGESDE